jgi:hypothetical protein
MRTSSLQHNPPRRTSLRFIDALICSGKTLAVAIGAFLHIRAMEPL